MFNKVLGGPLVQLIEQHGDSLVFKAKKQPKLDTEIPLRVEGQLKKALKVKATVESCRALEEGGYLCSARVAAPAQQRELAQLGAHTSSGGLGLRRDRRIPRRVKISSGEESATTIDISPSGVQIESAMALGPEQTLRLSLMPGLNVVARVAWAQGSRAGLEFSEVDEATRLLLSHFASGRAIPHSRESKPGFQSKVVAPPSYESL